MRRLMLSLLVLLALPAAASAAPWGQLTPFDSTGSRAGPVATSPSGNAIATWTRGDGSVVAVTKRPGEAWGAPHVMGVGAVDLDAPVAAIDAAGDAVVVWRTGSSGLMSAVLASDGTVGSPIHVGAPSLVGQHPAIAMGAGNEADLVFDVPADHSIRLATMAVGTDMSWSVGSAGVNQLVPVWDATPPVIRSNAAGDLVILMQANLGPPDLPLFSVFRHDGALGDPHYVSDSAAEADSFDAALDDDGNVTAVWVQETGSAGQPDIEGSTSRTDSSSWSSTGDLIDVLEGFAFVRVSPGPGGTADAAMYNVESEAHALLEVSHHDASGWSFPQEITARASPIVSASAPPVLETGGGAQILWTGVDSQFNLIVRAATRAPGSGEWSDPSTLPGLSGAVLLDAAADGAGNAVALLDGNGDNPAPQHVEALTFDSAPPSLTASGPASLPVGAAGTFAATASDAFAGLAGPVTWQFSDGASASGATVSHAFPAAGPQVAVAAVADAVGNVTTRTVVLQVTPLPGPAATDKTPPKLKLGPKQAKVKKGKVTVTVSCANEAVCSGTLTITVGGRKAGSHGFTARGGKAAKVTIKLSAKAQRSLKRKHRPGAKLSATATDPAGNRGTASAKLVLR